jgi:hypothetical protein
MLYIILVEESLGKHSLRVSRKRWKDNIKMDLRDIGRWMELAENHINL